MPIRIKSDLSLRKRVVGSMSDHVFQTAYARVRGRHSDKGWFSLSPREITNAIYTEIRAIDRERAMVADSGYKSVIAIAAE
jgi:hypothetical protein